MAVVLINCLEEGIHSVPTLHLSREQTGTQSNEVTDLRPRGGWLVMGPRVIWSPRTGPVPLPSYRAPRSEKKPQQLRELTLHTTSMGNGGGGQMSGVSILVTSCLG